MILRSLLQIISVTFRQLGCHILTEFDLAEAALGQLAFLVDRLVNHSVLEQLLHGLLAVVVLVLLICCGPSHLSEEEGIPISVLQLYDPFAEQNLRLILVNLLLFVR